MVRVSRIPALFGAQAMSVSPGLILIIPGRKDDGALIAHELKHAEQQEAAGLFRWWAKYLLSKAFRQAQEVEAYRVQIAHGASREVCARNLSTMYRLDLDLPTALWLLS